MGDANLAYTFREFPRAVELLTQIVRRAPASAQPYRTLGLVHEESRRPHKALQCFLIAALLAVVPRGKRWAEWARLLAMAARNHRSNRRARERAGALGARGTWERHGRQVFP